MVDYHLVVLVHGLWGNPSHMDYIERAIKERVADTKTEEQIYIYKTGSHTGFLTYDGIDVIGKRVCDEIRAETQALEEEKNKVVKISVVGYSLGGLISRYAIGYLYNTGYFDEIEPVTFTTFCTPHVGALNPGTSWGTRLFNYFVPHILVHTGTHIFLTDRKAVRTEGDTEEALPLLVWMSHPSSVFYKALKRFRTRNLYANVINDKRSSYFTSAISLRDPFNSMINENASAYNLEFISGYAPNVIDIKKPVTFKILESKASRSPKGGEAPVRVWSSILRKLNWLKVVASLVVITPVWAVWMVGNSVLQRFRSRRRVGSFFRDTNLLPLYSSHSGSATGALPADKLSRVTSNNEETLLGDITNSVKDQTDVIVESIFDAMNSDSYKDYHYSASKSSSTGGLVKSLPTSLSTDSLDLVNLKGKLQEFDLNLIEDQKTIIKNLNTLEWNKFPVLIRDTKQTHRAAIVRMPDPTFEEGKVIVRHFINEVFQF